MGRKIGDWHHYSGAIHVHTTESDGTKAFEEVVAIGREAGLDFIMFADHMTLSNREQGKEGLYGDLLAVVGYEHNDREDNHHYLLFGSPRVYPEDLAPLEYVAAGATDGAIGIMAHPDEVRDRLAEYPPYPWKDWTVSGFTGLEIWNQMSEWMERLTKYNKLLMAFSPRKSMVAPSDRVLKKWDELNTTGKVVGVASVDAHAFVQKVGFLRVQIFPYKVHFRCLRTHVILPRPMSKDFETAKRQLYDAIRDCRVYVSNMRWGDADRFEFRGESSDDAVVSGGELPAVADTRLYVNLPERATVKLVHNGQKILQTMTDSLEYKVSQPGIYRVEAWKGRRGWIFSNHIRVGM